MSKSQPKECRQEEYPPATVEAERKQIREKVRTLVVYEKSPLSVVKGNILSLIGGLAHLSPILENYVEYKYFKYCLKCLEKDIRSKLLQTLSAEFLRIVATKAFSASELHQLPKYAIKGSTYFQLIISEERLLSADDKSIILRILKVAVAEAVVACTEPATAATPDKVSTLLELTRERFALAKNAFLHSNGFPMHAQGENTKLWEEYQSKHPSLAGELGKEAEQIEMQLASLQAEISKEPLLLQQEFEGKRRDLVSQLLTPLSITTMRQYGKQSLVCRKPIMLLSECIEEIERNLGANNSSSVVEEVHIVAAEAIYINCHLKESLWHGKNVLVISKKIEVIEPGTMWDLSGQRSLTANHDGRARDGTENDLDGHDGGDGSPGESGGNGVLIADNFLRLNQLTLKTNGGAGGRGQDGGNGQNGRAGKSGDEMSLDTLQRDYPSPARFVGFQAAHARSRTMQNVRGAIKIFEADWSEGSDGTLCSYIRGTTPTGLHIEFSNYCSDPFRRSYILVKGATGEPGEHGGFGGSGGRGGEGGYPGRLNLYHLNGTVYNNRKCRPGYSATRGVSPGPGDDGKDGGNGVNGQNGRDVGYMDYNWWSAAVYYGPGTYELREDSNEPNSSWCPYHKQWRKLATSSRAPPQQIDQIKVRHRKIKFKLNVAATKKNPINTSQVLEMYSDQVKNASYSTEFHQNPQFERILKDVMSSSRNLIQNEMNHKKTVTTKVKLNKPAPSLTKYPRKRKPTVSDSFKSESKMNELIQSSPLCLRFEALQEIRKVLTPEWGNWSKTKVEYVVTHPTSTKSHNSALHALFGQINNLGYYEAHSGIRKQVCDELRKKCPFTGRINILERLQESLMAYFEDKSEPPSAKWSSSNGEEDESERPPKQNPTEMLDKYAQEFCLKPEAFDWDALLRDSTAIEEYIEFLAHPSIPFLISDLRLVAAVKGISVEMYLIHDNNGPSSAFIPLDIIIIDPAIPRPEALRIAVNKAHEFSRMSPIRRRDMSQVYTRMENIVREVYSFDQKSDLENYIKNRKYGVDMELLAKKPDDDSNEKTSIDDVLALVRQVSASFVDTDEKLVVETALLGWPLRLLQVFSDRIKMTESETPKSKPVSSSQRLRLAFTKITEFTLREEGNKYCEKLSSFMWAISTYPEQDWAREICIICLEDYFERVVNSSDVTTWRALLSGLPEGLIHCLVQLIDSGSEFGIDEKEEFLEFLELIRNCELKEEMDFDKLEGVGKGQWPYQLKKLLIASKLERLPNVAWDDDDGHNKISQALYFLHSLFNEKEEEVRQLLENLEMVLSRHKTEKCTVNITQMFSNFYGGLWTLDFEAVQMLQQKSSSVDEWWKYLETKNCSTAGSGTMRSLTEIREIIASDSNTTLSLEEIGTVVKIISLMSENEQTNTTFNLSELKSEIQGKSLSAWKEEEEEEKLIRILAKVVQAVDHVIGRQNPGPGYDNLRLRPTQKFAIIATLLLGSRGKNLLSQISTGEGKTFVVLAVAIVLALFGHQKIDIVTSSGVLAQRDATAYQNIFEAFDLRVGEVTSESQEERGKAYQSCDVVYGEAAHFERDYLLDRFYNQNIRGSRGFTNLIVDEVDSMFLDKGNSVLYLSHQPPDLDSLEALFIFIWLNVVRTVNSGEFHLATIHELVMRSIYPTISTEDLLSVVNDGEIQGLRNFMVEKKLINGAGRIIASWRDCSNILQTLPEMYDGAKKQIGYLIKKQLEVGPGRIAVMRHLKPFVEHHLYSWVKSAFQATQLTEGKEYVVDVDRSKTHLDKNPKIMILDLDTGVDLRESQWSNALHQFLQLKHGCKLSLMSLKAVFISNISFFKKYQGIFGLTGTIGTEADRKFLKSTYAVEFLCMPLALPKQFIEEGPIISEDVSAWKARILEDAEAKLGCGRSVLIICGTVLEAEHLHAHFLKAKATYPIELSRRDYETFRVTQEGQSLEPGRVIIATNLAGRGTDIKLSPELKGNGGLHVILSYLPENLRVEQQAFGRTARCGAPGTGRLIFLDTVCSSTTTGKPTITGDAINLKIQRDDLEIRRVTVMLSYYNNVIRKEEDMFEKFQESFEQLSSALDKYDIPDPAVASESQPESSNCDDKSSRRNLLTNHARETKELVVYSLLDDWAFWLDRYSTVLLSMQDPARETNMLDKGLYKFETDEQALIQEFLRMTGRYEETCSKYNKDPGWPQTTWNWVKAKTDIMNAGGPPPPPPAGFEDYALTLIREPALLIKLAKCFISRKEYRRAQDILEKVVQEEDEEEHSTVALYYQLYCKLKQKSWNTDDDEFRRLADKLTLNLDESRIRESSYASTITGIQVVDSQRMLHGNGYRVQKENVMKLIGMYRTSIEDLVGTDRILPQQHFSPLLSCESGRERLCDLLVKEGALLPAIFTPFKEDADAEEIRTLADSFCMTTNKTRQILQKFTGEKLTPAIEKQLKAELDFPSRSGFWKQIATTCLEHVQTFAVVLGQQPPPAEPDSSSQEDNHKKQDMNHSNNKKEEEKSDFATWIQSDDRHFISKYGTDLSDVSGPHKEILAGNKADFKLEQKFVYLRKTGQLCYEEVGYINVDKLKSVNLTSHHKIDKGVFAMIEGIGEEDSAKIFEILLQSGIVDEDGILQSADWSKERLDLTLDFDVYRADIQAILKSKCRYKYEVLSILHQHEQASNSSNNEDTPGKKKNKKTGTKKQGFELKVSLPSRPCKDFVMTAMELGFIAGLRPNPSYFKQEQGVGNFFKNVCREPASWIAWVATNTGISFGESTNSKLLQPCLIKTLFPTEPEAELEALYDELKEKRWIQPDGEIIFMQGGGQAGAGVQQQLSPKFEYHQPEILAEIEWVREVATENFLKDALTIVYEAQGKLTTLESPDASLVDVEVKFEGSNPPHKGDFAEEIATFTLSGFDHIIDTFEETYTLKMIFSAIAVVILGLAQIAAGIFLELICPGAGTFLAGGLIQEGVGDVIYGLMAFKSGHFSWQDWVDNKWRSIFLTVVTMGIGGLLSIGVKYSKYGQRLFGSWGTQISGRAVQEALKGTGKAGIKRSVFRVLLKSFGYNVLHGCAAAGGSVAVSYAYDKALKKFIDAFCANLFAKTHATVENHNISNTLSDLVDRVGVDTAQGILDRCTTRVLKNSSSIETDAEHYLGQIVRPVLDGLKAAIEKMSRAGTFATHESNMLMAFLQLSYHLKTTADVISALSKMGTSITKHLNEVEKQVKNEMELMSTTTQQVDNQAKPVSQKDKDDFMHQFKEKTNGLMKEKIGGIMQHVIIQPLMAAGCQMLLSSIGRRIRGKIVEYRESRLKGKIERVKFELSSLNPDAPEERRRELHKQLVQLCSRSRDPHVVAHAVEFGGPLGVESVQALADKLGVRIVVESDNPNVPREFIPRTGSSNNDTGETLHLKHSVTSDDPNDLGHWAAASPRGSSDDADDDGQEGPSENPSSPDCLLDEVNRQLKHLSINPVTRAELADFMRKDPHFREFVKNGTHHTYNSIGGFGGAKDLKYKKFELVETEKQGIIEELTRLRDKIMAGENNGDSDNHVSKWTKAEGKQPAMGGKANNKYHPGPIEGFYREKIGKDEVTTFMYGTVTLEHVNKENLQPHTDRGEARKAKAAGGGCMVDDHAGHISAHGWGAPPALYNLFAQSAKENVGVCRVIEQTVLRFLRDPENSDKTPTVSFMRKLNWDKNPPFSGRPDSHTFYLEFKRNGVTIEDGIAVYKVGNPPCSLERKSKCRVAPGG